MYAVQVLESDITACFLLCTGQALLLNIHVGFPEMNTSGTMVSGEPYLQSPNLRVTQQPAQQSPYSMFWYEIHGTSQFWFCGFL